MIQIMCQRIYVLICIELNLFKKYLHFEKIILTKMSYIELMRACTIIKVVSRMIRNS